MRDLLLILILIWRCGVYDAVEPPLCRTSTPPICNPLTTSYHSHDDCSMFYLCDHGQLATFSCPLGEYFDTNVNVCRPSNQVTCQTCVTDDEGYLLGYVFSSEQVKQVCPEIPTCSYYDWGVTKPYPPDCTKYIYCDSVGVVVIEDCSVGEHYSPTLFTCMDVVLANCTKCESNETVTTEGPTTMTAEEEITTIQVTTSTSEADVTLPDCPETKECEKEDHNKRIPYPPNCLMYIKCKQNFPDEYWSCPTGKEFSEATEKCEFPEIANCTRCSATGSTVSPITITESVDFHHVTQPNLFN